MGFLSKISELSNVPCSGMQPSTVLFILPQWHHDRDVTHSNEKKIHILQGLPSLLRIGDEAVLTRGEIARLEKV